MRRTDGISRPNDSLRPNSEGMFGRPPQASGKTPTFNNPWAGSQPGSQRKASRQSVGSSRPSVGSNRARSSASGSRESASQRSYARSSRGARSGSVQPTLGSSRDNRRLDVSPTSGRGGVQRDSRLGASGRTQDSPRSPRRDGRQGTRGGRVDRRVTNAPTVAQVRRRQSVEHAASFAAGIVSRILPLLIVVAIVFVLGAAIYHSSLFKVGSVEVVGNVRLTEEQVVQVAAVPDGSTLLRYDHDGIVSRLEMSPWIDEAKVSRRFPSTLRVTVTERSVAGLVMVAGAGASGASEPWAVSADGVWLAPVRNILIPAEDVAAAEADAQAEADAAESAKSQVPSKDVDTDGDGINDYYDADIDGDGVEEWRGLDEDGDGIIDGSYAEGFKFPEEMTPEERRRYEAGEPIDGSGGNGDEDTPAETSVSTVDANTAEEAALAANPDAIDASACAGVIQILGYSSATAPTAGTACEDAGVLNALGVINGLSSELLSQVSSISAESAEQTTLLLDSGIEVAFGLAENVGQKEEVVLQLLAEHEGSISYINVRVVDRPTWRGL